MAGMGRRYSPVLVSAVLQSLCLLSFVPGSLKSISTWRDATFEAGGYRTENLIMPLGCCFLGMALIGVTILWTAYRKNERWAWFAMLIVLVCFLFGGNMVPVVRMVYPPYFQWVLWFDCLRAGDWRGICLMVPEAGLPVLVMLLALLLPIKAFFWRSSRLD